MTRSALEFWGHNPEPDVAYVIINQRERNVVTWDEVNEEKRETQRKHLDEIRHAPVMRISRLWVGYNPHFFFGGWFAVIENVHHSECVWGRTPILMERVMELFPITFRYGNLNEDFQMWCEAFSKTYPRGRYGGRQRGFAIVRWDGFRELALRKAASR
ncbi:hypothetical protein [Gimesia fumaroli]|nr:hypothetical protein [Gimesia fumaroli]